MPKVSATANRKPAKKAAGKKPVGKEAERVMCIPAEVLRSEGLGLFQGFSHSWPSYFKTIVRGVVSYVARGLCETDPSLKQIIPYVMFRHVHKGQDYLLRYTRSKKPSAAGEERLRGKYSLGIGGHISHTPEEDAALAYWKSYHREIAEELQVFAPAVSEEMVGVLNDDETEVGRVHLGFVHRVTLAHPGVYGNEAGMVDLTWCTPASLWSEYNKLEAWSKMVLTGLYPKD